MIKLKLCLGLLLILVLSTGLVSTYGCSALSQPTTSAQPITEMPVTQLALETIAAQPTLVVLVTPPASTTAAPVITPTTTVALVITPTITAEPIITPTTTVPAVITTPPPTSTTSTIVINVLTATAQESLLAEIRSKAEQPSPGIYYIDAATAKMLADNTSAVIMDARYLVDYELLHLAGAISLPVSSVWKGYIDPTTILTDKDAILIAYCAPGCPAGLELAAELAARGYHNLFVLIGGYLYWQEAGYPMVIKQ